MCQSAIYRGAIQFLIAPSGGQMTGKWLGFGKNFAINTGDWELTLEDRSTSRSTLGKYHLKGEKKSEREEKKDKTHWLERTFGSFSRSFSLPASAVSEELKAAFKEGVLSIEIPKKEQVKPRQISIK